MKIHIDIELDTAEENDASMARLSAIFSNPVHTITHSATYVVDGISQMESTTETKPVVEALPHPSLVAAPISGDVILTTTSGETVTATIGDSAVKRTRGKAKTVTTPLPEQQPPEQTDLAAALDTALDAMPGVTDLTAPVAAEPAQEHVEQTDEPTVKPTVDHEVAAVEDIIDVLTVVDPEPKTDTRPPVGDMDLTTAGAEIRRLVILNTGAWLRDTLNHYKVNRISDLALEQAHDAIRSGRALEDKRG
jgi:hypothetical protein